MAFVRVSILLISIVVPVNMPDLIHSSMKPMHQENHASAYQHMAQVEKELLDQIDMIIIMNTKNT